MYTIVVRRTMLSELFGAELMRRYHKSKVIATDPLVVPTPELLAEVFGHNVFLVGGYYSKSLDMFREVVKSLTIFYNSGDTIDDGNHTIIKASPNTGFATFMLGFISPPTRYCRIAQYLDDYYYGFPTKESMIFVNGVHAIAKSNSLPETDCSTVEMIPLMNDFYSIKNIEEAGTAKYKKNLAIAKSRLENAKQYSILGNMATVAIGGSPIVMTCLLLADVTGIGILVRHDEKQNRTYLSCRTTESSGINAGDLMRRFINGGGSHNVAGGSIIGIQTLDDIFFNERNY